MDFDFYRNFIVIAECGNLTAAAKKLALAQPALSAQLKTLERGYNVSLVKKGRGLRRIELTEAGEAFLRKARKICALEEGMLKEMDGFTKGTAGILKFSISPAATGYFMQKYLLPFAARHGDIDFELHETDVATQMEHIAGGVSDFAFANAPLPAPCKYQTCDGAKEYFYAVYAKNSALVADEQGTPRLGNLRGVKLACNFGCYKMLRQFFAEKEIAAQFAFSCTTVNAALEYAGAGLGMAVVPLSDAALLPEDLCCFKLDDRLYFEQRLFWRSEDLLPACGRLFLEYYRGAAENL